MACHIENESIAMYFPKTKTICITFLATAILTGCQESTLPKAGTGEATVPTTQKQELADQAITKRNTALLTPDWTLAETLPEEWTGLYQEDCAIGGPEKTSFFTYNNHLQNTQYHFTYIVYPPSLNKTPKAEVYPFTFRVWQNKNWPQHYLLFTTDSFTQILIEDGISQGLHQTLDGQPWDSTANYQTKYKSTDVMRWAVDIENREDYGSRLPCNPNLAQPWSNEVFKTKSGKSFTLKDIMNDH